MLLMSTVCRSVLADRTFILTDAVNESLRSNLISKVSRDLSVWKRYLTEEFDPGSERTLAAWLRHASRTDVCDG